VTGDQRPGGKKRADPFPAFSGSPLATIFNHSRTSARLARKSNYSRTYAKQVVGVCYRNGNISKICRRADILILALEKEIASARAQRKQRGIPRFARNDGSKTKEKNRKERPGHVGSTFKGAMMAVRGLTMDITKDIQAMTTFRRNPGKFMKHLKKTKKPLVLTINGKAEAVVQDAEAYQRLLDIAALADAREGIRQGAEDVKKGRVRPAREALEMFRRNHAKPR
jgi:PHD/YefM family antitoxin component YafN of YafNO toxin-antitoxin module